MGPVSGLVTMLIAPATADLPNSVLCGPFSTSMRVMSARSLKAWNWVAMGMSSMMTATSDSTPMPTETVPMPRMKMALLAAVVPELMVSDGIMLTTSSISRMLVRWISFSLMTEMAIGTLSSFSTRLLAVTTTVSSWPGWALDCACAWTLMANSASAIGVILMWFLLNTIVP